MFPLLFPVSLRSKEVKTLCPRLSFFLKTETRNDEISNSNDKNNNNDTNNDKENSNNDNNNTNIDNHFITFPSLQNTLHQLFYRLTPNHLLSRHISASGRN